MTRPTSDQPAPAAGAGPPPPRWGLGDAAAGLAIALVLGNLLAGVWLAASGSSAESLGVLAAGQVGLWAGLVGAPVVASRRKGRGTLAADFGLRAVPADAAALPLGAACQLAGVPVLYYLLERVFGDLNVSGPARELAERVAHPVAFAVMAVMVIVVAPVVEELFYRGLLLRSLERRFGTGAAIVGSSTLFGLSHFQLVQFPGLFGLALVLALLAVRTGRLGASIFAHQAFNGVTVISLALAR